MEVSGRLVDERTVVLDEPLAATHEHVRVAVRQNTEPASPPRARLDVHEFLRELRAAQNARGFQPSSPEEVIAYLEGERNSWGD